jgi:hypothetical protein
LTNLRIYWLLIGAAELNWSESDWHEASDLPGGGSPDVFWCNLAQHNNRSKGRPCQKTEQALQAGAIAYLSKPFNDQDLLDVLALGVG